jgi:hypothetical protein
MGANTRRVEMSQSNQFLVISTSWHHVSLLHACCRVLLYVRYLDNERQVQQTPKMRSRTLEQGELSRVRKMEILHHYVSRYSSPIYFTARSTTHRCDDSKTERITSFLFTSPFSVVFILFFMYCGVISRLDDSMSLLLCSAGARARCYVLIVIVACAAGTPGARLTSLGLTVGRGA